MKRSLLSLLCLFLLLSFAPVGAEKKGGDETITNFKKYYKTYKETALRVEAVLSLEDLQDPAVVDTLVPIFKDGEKEVVYACIRILSRFKERPPIDAMLAVLKDEKSEAIRTGILLALAEGKYKDCGPGIIACLTDKSWDVRRRALQALAVQNDPALAPQIVPLCDDQELAVRCEALEALAGLKSELVVPKAVVAINDPDIRARDSGLKALMQVRHKDAVEPLIKRMAVEQGRLVPDLAETLANLTGKEFGAEPEKWTAWWAENKATFVLPTLEAIAYLRGHREAATGGSSRPFPKSGVSTFGGIPTASRSIMFVIDVSGSMEAEVTEKERFSDGKYPSYQRIDIVKTELARVIDRLDSNVNFNIISFATKVDPWKGKLQPANVLNKSAAKDWVMGRVAIGGASKEDLAMAGLSSSANLDQGKTNTYGALMAALNVPTGKGAKGPSTGTGAVEAKDYKVDVDTIYFLSDGRPTVGDFIDPADILREVKAANELRKVVIHTLAIGEFEKDFMKRIAEQNGGVFVDLGK